MNQGILIIRGHNVLRFRKMDYTEHADAKQLRMEKVVEHIQSGFQSGKRWKQENLFQGQELESNLEPNRDDSAITKSAEENPLTVAERLPRKPAIKEKRAPRFTKVEDLFSKDKGENN